jgi:hypothetical protein|tara:strand:+ start:2220 stop:2564 length:345 start_codon:yes stop_codon:yes gene_type:complete
MEEIPVNELIPGEEYYIKSLQNENARQIAICKKVNHIQDDKYSVEFADISEIKKSNGYGHSGLHFGKGSRHCYWFSFHKVYSIKYKKKIDELYKIAINTYLQKIIGDCNFQWYI